MEADQARFEELGVELKDYFLTCRQDDVVYVAEAPDDETYSQAVLSNAKEGYASSETLRAFPADQYREILEGIPE